MLADLLSDAAPRQYAVLFAVLERSREQADALLSAELARTPQAHWSDKPLDPTWQTPSRDLVRQVEQADGMVAERFALCQTLPLDQFNALAGGLRRCGYRPVRLRPYATSGGLDARRADGGDEPRRSSVLVAAVWTRDGRAWHAAHGLTAEQVRDQDRQRRKEGFQPMDVAGCRDDGHERYAVLWVKGGREDEARFYVGVPEKRHQADGWGPMGQAKLSPVTLQVVIDSTGQARYSAVWRKSAENGISFWHRDEGALAARALSDGPALDVSLCDRHAAARELLDWVSGSPWAGLAVRSHYSRLPHPERSYAATFLPGAPWEQVLAVGLPPDAQRARCRDLAGQGYRPAALTVAVFALSRERQRPEDLLTASVWHRPMVPLEARDRLAKRQANAAVALLRLGQAERVWPLLQHRPDPRLRSYLIHRLGPLGADARVLVRRLADEPEVSARRPLPLSLGEFTPEQFSLAERQALLPALSQTYREDPDPGVHAAAEWLLRRWQHQPLLDEVEQQWTKDRPRRDQRVARLAQQLAREKEAAKPQWYVNGQGQTMVIVPGPVEFLMGSPPTEAGRSPIEVLHRRRIGRSFAIASKPVTVAQFRRYLEANPEVQTEFEAGGWAAPSILVGGVEDHVHILCTLSREESIAVLIRELKRESSKALKEKGVAAFYWQAGYGAFSVSPAHVAAVKDYIARQGAHHQKVTFQDESRRLLKKYRVGYDERYVWDCAQERRASGCNPFGVDTRWRTPLPRVRCATLG